MAARRPARFPQYTIGWVSALAIELAAAQEMLDESHEPPFRNASDTNIYTLGRIGEHNVVITCLPYSQMGTNSAAVVVSQMKSTFPTIQFILMIGVGGGVPRADLDIRLGDVVVSRPNELHGGVVQYDFGKATQKGFQRTRFLNNPSPLLLKGIAQLEANHIRERIRFLDYVSRPSELEKFKREAAGPDLLFRADYEHVGGDTCVQCSRMNLVERKPRDKEIMIHYGTIASGNQVMKNALERDRLSSELGGVLCFEMEAAGLMNDFPCLVIRGICDYADSHKNKGWQGYAAATAASYAKELLSVIPPVESQLSVTSEAMIEGNNTLSQLPVAADAQFNSYKRRQDPICFPNTRVDVLHKINMWIHQQDQRCLFWLNGLAGTGKSTIARTIARQSDEAGILGASFFFSRGGGDTGTAQKFVTSIARQLASRSPIFEKYIYEAIQQHQDIANQSLTDQWRRLIAKPSSSAHGRLYPPFFVIVIDALDECDDHADIITILRLLTEAQSGGFQLRFFLTSRPEVPVRRVFNKVPHDRRQDFILHEIIPETTEDLFIYFTETLAEIAENHDLGVGWPGSEMIQQLVDDARGLFIWAATACRFIDDGNQFARDRLLTLLQSRSPGNEPQRQLDKIYNTVFINSISPTYSDAEKKKAYASLRDVLGTIVVLFSELSINSLATLLGIDSRGIQRTLGNLHAILVISDDSCYPLRLHHPSLRDFLLDNERCTNPDLYVHETEAHQQVLNICIRLMSTYLKKDICGLGGPGTLLRDVSSDLVKQCLPPELQYACLYWAQHLVKSGIQVYDDDFIHRFLKRHLLHWLEALSLMGNLSKGILLINSLLSFTSSRDCPRFCDFIQDAKRFVLYNQHCLQQAPLQVYFSALVFAPVRSVIRNQFKELALEWIKQIPEIRMDWSACLQTLEGHTDFLLTITFRPDGKMLASSSCDKTVRLWDTATGQCLQTLEGHTDFLLTIAFRPDGRMLATSSYDNTVRLWDTTTGQCLQTLEDQNKEIGDTTFSPDGKILGFFSQGDTVHLWDTITNQGPQTPNHDDYLLPPITFSPDGEILASASDHNIYLWDTRTGQCLRTLGGERQSAIAFTPDGKILASASYDSAHLWDTTTGQRVYLLDGCNGPIAFSPDGKILASSSRDKIRLWDTTAQPRIQQLTNQCLQVRKGHNDRIKEIAFSPDSKILASSSHDNIYLWDTTNGQCLQTLECYDYWRIYIAFSPDGKILASSTRHKICLWDTTTGQSLQALGSFNEYSPAIAFSSDSKILASTSGSNSIYLWDTTVRKYPQTIEGHNRAISTLIFRPDGKMLASGSHDKTIRLWDTTTGQCLHTLEGHNKIASTIIFSPDSKILAYVSYENSLHLWDTTTGQCLHALEDALEDHGGSPCFLYPPIAFKPDNKLLASALTGKTIRLWDNATGKCLQTLEGHNMPVSTITFNPDGKILASGSFDKTIRLWDTTTGQCLRTLEDHGSSGSPLCPPIAFSPDSKLLASSLNGETIHLWDTMTGQCLQTLGYYTSSVKTVIFSPDSRILASLSAGTIKIRDTTTGEVLQTLEGHTSMTALIYANNRPYLNTDSGWARVDLNLPWDLECNQEPPPALSITDSWVTLYDKNFLWVPPEYREFQCSSVHNNIIALGYSSGQVINLIFSFN